MSSCQELKRLQSETVCQLGQLLLYSQSSCTGCNKSSADGQCLVFRLLYAVTGQFDAVSRCAKASWYLLLVLRGRLHVFVCIGSVGQQHQQFCFQSWRRITGQFFNFSVKKRPKQSGLTSELPDHARPPALLSWGDTVSVIMAPKPRSSSKQLCRVVISTSR